MSEPSRYHVRDVWLLLVGMGLNSLPFGYTLVVLPIYLHDLNFSGEVIGAVTAASSIANTISLVPFAIAADKYGRRKFVVAGFLFATFAYLIFSLTRDLNLLLLASALGGVGLAGGVSAAVWTPAWTALLSEKAPLEKRTHAFALSQGIWTIALTIGSAMSILPELFRTYFSASYVGSYSYTFLMFALIAVISAVFVIPIPEAHANSSIHTEKLKLVPKKSISQIWKFSITIGLVGFGSGLSVQLLSFWFNRVYGVNEALLGPWFAAAEVTSLVIVPIIPILITRFGSSGSVLASQSASAVFLAMMVLAPTYQAAGILYIIRNFFMNIAWPIQQSYLMGTVTAEERASASAITSTIWGVGASVGPFLAGYLLNQNSQLALSAPLIFGGGIYLLSAIMFYLLFRKTPPPEEQ